MHNYTYIANWQIVTNIWTNISNSYGEKAVKIVYCTPQKKLKLLFVKTLMNGKVSRSVKMLQILLHSYQFTNYLGIFLKK